jgi:hypothetical protein
VNTFQMLSTIDILTFFNGFIKFFIDLLKKY